MEKVRREEGDNSRAATQSSNTKQHKWPIGA